MLLSASVVLQNVTFCKCRVAKCYFLQASCCKMLLSASVVLQNVTFCKCRVAKCYFLQVSCCKMLLSASVVLQNVTFCKCRVAKCYLLQVSCCKIYRSCHSTTKVPIRLPRTLSVRHSVEDSYCGLMDCDSAKS